MGGTVQEPDPYSKTLPAVAQKNLTLRFLCNDDIPFALPANILFRVIFGSDVLKSSKLQKLNLYSLLFKDTGKSLKRTNLYNIEDRSSDQLFHV